MKERAKEIALYFIEHKVATIKELMAYVKVSFENGTSRYMGCRAFFLSK